LIAVQPDTALLSKIIERYLNFLSLCYRSDFDFSMTSRDPYSSPFARCFWVFGMHSIKATEMFNVDREKLALAIIRDLQSKRKSISPGEELVSKEYKQLLAFSLSALRILNQKCILQTEEFLVPFCKLNIVDHLDMLRVSEGLAGSGNHAMFLGQFLIEAQNEFQIDTMKMQEKWVDYHLTSMNEFGLWGNSSSLTYLQFQNGYHQYEIFDYLGVETGRETKLVNELLKLADRAGQFAPYPGGGGCFDYDAIYLLHSLSRFADSDELTNLFRTTLKTISLSQNSDGGFAENLWVRPRSFQKFLFAANDACKCLSQPQVLKEKVLYLCTLQRPKHNQIKTHWSPEPRYWSESNLWDSWFRMLTLARCWAAVEPETQILWDWSQGPGIGHSNGG